MRTMAARRKPLRKIRKSRRKPSRMALVRSSRPGYRFSGTKREPDNSRRSAATQKAILAAAARLVRRRGYNAVSYYDLSRSVGVTTATIHYYFPTKADLATAAIQRYTHALEQQLQAISASVNRNIMAMPMEAGPVGTTGSGARGCGKISCGTMMSISSRMNRPRLLRTV